MNCYSLRSVYLFRSSVEVPKYSNRFIVPGVPRHFRVDACHRSSAKVLEFLGAVYLTGRSISVKLLKRRPLCGWKLLFLCFFTRKYRGSMTSRKIRSVTSYFRCASEIGVLIVNQAPRSSKSWQGRVNKAVPLFTIGTFIFAFLSFNLAHHPFTFILFTCSVPAKEFTFDWGMGEMV